MNIMKKFAAFVLCLCALLVLTAGVALAEGNVQMTIDGVTATFQTFEAALEAQADDSYGWSYAEGDSVQFKLLGDVVETTTLALYDMGSRLIWAGIS